MKSSFKLFEDHWYQDYQQDLVKSKELTALDANEMEFAHFNLSITITKYLDFKYSVDNFTYLVACFLEFDLIQFNLSVISR